MRLFAAIPIPPPARDELAVLLADLRRTGWPVRWVQDDALHVTLKFYGDVDAGVEKPLAEALRLAVQDERTIPMSCQGLGAFPTLDRARVVWIGIEAPAALELLQHRLETASASQGFPAEGRPFRPHVTLGRVKDGMRLPGQGLESMTVTDIQFLGEELILYESRMGPRGPSYAARHSMPFSQG